MKTSRRRRPSGLIDRVAAPPPLDGLDPTSSPNAHFHKILKSAGLADVCAEMRPYDLKHSCVSILIDAGVPLKDISERTGVSVETLLKFYAPVHPDAQTRATAVLDRVLAR